MERNDTVIKVSVVMAAYNAGNYIEEAIDSVLEDDSRDIELVVVDDCSSDATAGILKRRSDADYRIRVFATEEPSGSAYIPRKKAVEKARGKFVLQLDADDRLEKGYINRILAVQEKTGADAVLGLMVDYDSPDDCVTPWQKKNCPEGTVLSGRECVALTLDGWRIGLAGALMRRDICMLVGEKYKNNKTYSCADELLSRQQLSMMRSVGFASVKYCYRVVPGSVTRGKSLKLFDFLRNNVELIALTRELYGENSEEYALAHCQNFHGLFSACRIARRFGFSNKELHAVRPLFENARRAVAAGVVKGRVSPRYYALFRLDSRLFAPVLGLIDRLLGIK